MLSAAHLQQAEKGREGEGVRTAREAEGEAQLTSGCGAAVSHSLTVMSYEHDASRFSECGEKSTRRTAYLKCEGGKECGRTI